MTSRWPSGDHVGSQAPAIDVKLVGTADPSDGAIQPLPGPPPIDPEKAMKRPSGDQAIWLKPLTEREIRTGFDASASPSTTSAVSGSPPGLNCRQASRVPSRENAGS